MNTNESQNNDNQDIQTERLTDLPVTDERADQVVGGAEAAGPMRESMETMKKAWKDASTTPEGKA